MNSPNQSMAATVDAEIACPWSQHGLSGRRPSSPFAHGHCHLMPYVWPTDSITTAVAFNVPFSHLTNSVLIFPHCLILYLWMMDDSSHLLKIQRSLTFFLKCLLFCFHGTVHLALVVNYIMTSLGFKALCCRMMEETMSIYISGCHKHKYEWVWSDLEVLRLKETKASMLYGWFSIP